MILKRVPAPILIALGLGCGPTAGGDEATSSACLSPPYDDDGTDVGPCLSECLGMLPTTDEGTTTSESDVGPCLDTTSPCLSPPEESSDTGGSFIVVTDTSSGTSTDSGTDSDSGSGTESGTDSGGGSTSGGTEDTSPRARSWREALERMDGTLPSDVLAKLRAQKGPR